MNSRHFTSQHGACAWSDVLITCTDFSNRRLIMDGKFDVGAVGFLSSTIWLYANGHWICGTVSLTLLIISNTSTKIPSTLQNLGKSKA